MTKLLIVESPGKIKKIKSFLGSDYKVMASIGHIRDLKKSYDAIDYNNNFTPKYEIMKDKLKVVKDLKKACYNIKDIYIASDNDREGEAIAYHLIEVLKLKKYKRIVFNEITKKAIEDAIKNPRILDINMVNAQQTRRILDRIIGFKLSPLLKRIDNIKTNDSSLGIGRVQAAILKLIIEKEENINNFANVISSYNVIGNFIIEDKKLKGNYINYNKIEKVYKTLLKNKTITIYEFINEKVDDSIIQTFILNVRLEPIFYISNIKNSEKYKYPQEPFITSTLQQEASNKLHFNIKKTMQIAQKLYEKGYITYMRTDSPVLSNKILVDIKKYIEVKYGEEYYEYRQYKTKNKNAQEAHEAIRPTNIDIINIEDTEENKLYKLIWNRTISSQMKSAKYIIQNIILKNKLFVEFECINSILIFDGFLKLYNIKIDENNKININSIVKWNTININETYKNPPSRYNEATLVRKLENLNIGRPSTYVSIISKIQEHKYIKYGNIEGIEKNITNLILRFKDLKLFRKETKQYIGKENNKIIPENNSYLIVNFLNINFPKITNYKFTAELELLLDEIANGNKIWIEVLKEFYSDFNYYLNNYKKT